jgi:predicted amidophosphoribosyltransferase
MATDERCPYCDGVVDRTDKECPHCKRRLTGRALLENPPAIVRAAEARQAAVNASVGTRKCPFCAEEIQAAAIVCKHCGRNLSVQAKPKTNVLIIVLAIIGALSILGFFARACFSPMP